MMHLEDLDVILGCRQSLGELAHKDRNQGDPGRKVGCLHDADPFGGDGHRGLSGLIETGGAEHPRDAGFGDGQCVNLGSSRMGEVDDDIGGAGEFGDIASPANSTRERVAALRDYVAEKFSDPAASAGDTDLHERCGATRGDRAACVPSRMRLGGSIRDAPSVRLLDRGFNATVNITKSHT